MPPIARRRSPKRHNPDGRSRVDLLAWAATIVAAVALVPLLAACSSVLDSAGAGDTHSANSPTALVASASASVAMGEEDADADDSGPAGPIGPDDGYIADDDPLPVDDDDAAAIRNLRPALHDALQQAAWDARQDGIGIRITSGWRSKALQTSLLQQAIATYGSEREARKYVNTPEQSTHVTGDAVDVAPADAMSWLSQYGSDYGLCQMYANESWHFELAVGPGNTCPAPSPDASGG
jgi:D-alanyl-D-alanine carboxypeptidase